ncbi:2-hydroxy-6-oxo-6-phenylhexa-2,4-dienoate hydrolase [Methanocella sp. CWC-04]|uniref:2-hydroxy-6-oxo-6-phenylhexa-2,4-dienoate hydrolase n=1 Tax=Methanooceanicella nereidis TaxID=2052831 RepID=A0AAP2W4R2_9EURY|nr:alpha/beta hydrolase [Methanocella sp. CWC-04]MCD1294630.1 2-hydroxy-6-oxo-6-phenylhexa-2,4-dienoate hydrolase [Methanocella sp. CWC-04]
MFCEIEGIPVHYEIYGDGKPVLMIHGYGVDRHLMKGCMEPIFKNRPGWKRIYFDLPGMGETKSDPRVKNSDIMLDIVLKFIDRIIPGQNFLVAGESYGGYLSRGLVYKSMDRIGGLLLICPLIEPLRIHRDLPQRTVLVRDTELIADMDPLEAKEFCAMAVVQSPGIFEKFKRDVMPGIISADEDFLAFFQKQGYGFSFDVDRISRPFEKPALILMGRQDSAVGYRNGWKIIENYPRGTFAVLDRAGHNLQIEQQRLFEELVNEWLDRVDEQG